MWRKNKNPLAEGSEATIGFEPMMRVLQTLALPLGHVAIKEVICLIKKRAGSETRTRDLLLGKEVFYQLNYTRVLSFFVDFNLSLSSTMVIIRALLNLSRN